MAPDSIVDFVWWALNGVLVAFVGLSTFFIGMILKRLDKICEKLEAYDATTGILSRAIVELQTRCAMNHKYPVENSVHLQ